MSASPSSPPSTHPSQPGPEESPSPTNNPTDPFQVEQLLAAYQQIEFPLHLELPELPEFPELLQQPPELPESPGLPQFFPPPQPPQSPQLPQPPNHPPTEPHQPTEQDSAATIFQTTHLSTDQSALLSNSGVQFSRSQSAQRGIHIPRFQPLRPLIEETVNKRAALWRGGIRRVLPNLEESYLDRIEADTKLGILYDFLALSLAEPESRLLPVFDTHESRPAA